MMIEITLQNAVSIISLGLTFAGIMGTILWRVWIATTNNKSELQEFRLEVAKDYASNHMMRDVELKLATSEERLISSIQSLTSRIDRLLTKVSEGR